MTDIQTAMRNELARKRPANAPVQREDDVIDGQSFERPPAKRKTGFDVFALLVLLVVAFLFAGFALSTL